MQCHAGVAFKAPSLLYEHYVGLPTSQHKFEVRVIGMRTSKVNVRWKNCKDEIVILNVTKYQVDKCQHNSGIVDKPILLSPYQVIL